jgi:alpha,alpha-trehalase
MKGQLKYFFILAITLASCSRNNVVEVDFYNTELFQRVQLDSVFSDSKTFVDCTPRKPLAEILTAHDEQKNSPGFDLTKFVNQYFTLPQKPVVDSSVQAGNTPENHIEIVWHVLLRSKDEYNPLSSLLPLPHPYIVPGGRFTEIYYWDSYFTMLGLMANHKDWVKNMIDNFSFLIDSVGFVPNGNRAYYLSRSQPPFFSLMIKLWETEDSLATLHYLPSMLKEYAFWMEGEDQLQFPGDVSGHVVKMPDGTIMNRYYDKLPAPRPESFREDYNLALRSKRNAHELYTDLRSAAESGWDFSSRWLANDSLLQSIQTTAFIPVDLNCLLWHLEIMIAKGYQLQNNETQALAFKNKADARRRALITFCYSPEDKYFFDFNLKTNKRSTRKTLAGAYPLFFKLCSPDVAVSIKKIIDAEFLKPGGLVTTLINSGQQWDSPNGWAPLQWIVYKGLKNYGEDTLANEIKRRWLFLNRKILYRSGKMLEKYNVVDTTLWAGGGEYPTQDGFGWTNGVYVAMKRDSVP